METPRTQIVAFAVGGGWRAARVWWTQPHGEDWDQEHEFMDDKIYLTIGDCLATIEEMRIKCQTQT